MIKIGAETQDKIGIHMIVNMDFTQDDLKSLAMLFEFHD